jgi:hypothetical protein
MAAVLPKNLALLVQRLANFHRTVTRIRPQSQDSAVCGQTVTFRLPTNTLIDLHNLQITGEAVISSGPEVANANLQALMALPRSMQGVIERLDVVVNGQTISGTNQDYGAIHALLTQHIGTKEGALTGAFLESGDMKPDHTYSLMTQGGASVGNVIGSANTAGTLADFAATAYEPQANLKPFLTPPVNPLTNGICTARWPFSMSGFLGFLGGGHVRFIDTAVLGPVEIRIRLAPAGIMYGRNWRTSATLEYPNSAYALVNLYMNFDTVSFTDDFYRAMLARRLVDGGMITIPFQNIFSFQKSLNAGSSGDTMSFNLGTQSLDFLIGTLRDSRYSSSAVKKVTGDLNLKNATFTSGTAIALQPTAGSGREYVATLDTSYYKFNSFCYNCNYWQTAQATIAGNPVVNPLVSAQYMSPLATYQFLVNNLYSPSWPATVNECYALARAAFDISNDVGDVGMIQSQNQFRNDAFAFVQSYQHHTDGEKVISGLDTRGASSNMAFMMNSIFTPNDVGTDATYGFLGNGQGAVATVWALTTSTLEISAGQNVIVIF